MINYAERYGINKDVKECFNKAIANKTNFTAEGELITEFVEADMCIDLKSKYNFQYIHDCFDALMDEIYA